MHRFSSHVDEMVLTLWLGGVSIGDLENDGTGFLFDVVEEVLWRLEDVQEEMYRLFFLSTIEKLKRRVATGDTSDVLAVDLEVVREPAESQCVLPSNPAPRISSMLLTLGS